MKKKAAAFLIVLTVAVSLWAKDQHTGHEHNGHPTTNSAGSSTPLIEGGEAAFSALIEVVALLESDENTDWSNVNIGALHEHLRDMNHVMLNTEVVSHSLTSSSVMFKVTATAIAEDSLRRSLQAHSDYIASIRPWEIQVVISEDGATVEIAPNSASELQKLNALGFYGFMALDSHHQAHHWLIATGQGGQAHGSH